MLLFKSKEYREGWRAGKEGVSQLDNPYTRDAAYHNLEYCKGKSPWWATDYRPFIDWNHGHRDARQPMIDEYFKQLNDRIDNTQE